MLARRNFLYKRTLNGAHRNILARANSSQSSQPQPNAVSSPSSDAKSPDPIAPLTSVQSPAQTTDTPSASSVSPSTVPSSASTPVSSHSQSSDTATSSLTVSASSHSLASSSTPLSPLASPTTANAFTVNTQVPGISYTPTATVAYAASASPSTGSSGGASTSTIVGGVAGTLAGIAFLGLLLMWCMRRQRNRDIDDFDAQAFKRQSAILVDDPVESSYNPRPPTMIERHNGSPALAAQSGYGGQNFYGSYGGYGQQPSYPNEMVQPTVSPPPQAYSPPSMGYPGYDDPRQQIVRQPSNAGYANYGSQQQLSRQPSDARYLTRQPSAATGYVTQPVPPSSVDSNAHYIDLNRSSVSPYQAAQYADISRQLGAVDPNEQGHHAPHTLLDGPLPSPFDDPSAGTQPGPGGISHGHPSQPLAAAAPRGPSVHFEQGDAYGGI